MSNYRTQLRQLYGRIEWICGDGRFALVAHCPPRTVTLWPTRERAEDEKKNLDCIACGHTCTNDHEIIELENYDEETA